MAVNATAVWRVRPSGNNTNGGGFDCAISSTATGTHGSFTGTTFTDATAAAFTAGMVGSAINIAGVGQYLITARIDASNITLGSGNPAMTLVGPLTWTVGKGQDYSQQNGAQLSQLGATSTSTVTLTDLGASFTADLIGNAIRVAGSGITTTYTYITAVPTPTTLTLQTSPGTTGTSVTYNIGGGWADYWTNINAAAVTAAGNIIYMLGSGTPNSAAYTYDYDQTAAFTTTNLPTGMTFLWNDPATPGYKAPPDTTGGMPVIKFDVAATAINMVGNGALQVAGLWFVGTTTAATKYVMGNAFQTSPMYGCVLDQFAKDVGLYLAAGGSAAALIFGCEVFSSAGGTGGGAGAISSISGLPLIAAFCNFHDLVGDGVVNGGLLTMFHCIIAKCNQEGILSTGRTCIVVNCTIDGNLLNGINNGTAQYLNVFSCIISNHTTGGKFGITSPAYSNYCDFNSFYNNTVNVSSQTFNGPHNFLSGNPYVGQATENYTLA